MFELRSIFSNHLPDKIDIEMFKSMLCFLFTNRSYEAKSLNHFVQTPDYSREILDKGLFREFVNSKRNFFKKTF